MGKQAKPKKAKVIYPKGEPTPSVESTYQVSLLMREQDADGNKLPGQWADGGTHKSFGRKALVKQLRATKNIGQFRVRKVA